MKLFQGVIFLTVVYLAGANVASATATPTPSPTPAASPASTPTLGPIPGDAPKYMRDCFTQFEPNYNRCLQRPGACEVVFNQYNSCVDKGREATTASTKACEDESKAYRDSQAEMAKKCSRTMGMWGRTGQKKDAKSSEATIDHQCSERLRQCEEKYEDMFVDNDDIPDITLDTSDATERMCLGAMLGGRKEEMDKIVDREEKKEKDLQDQLTELLEKQKQVQEDATEAITKKYAEITKAMEAADKQQNDLIEKSGALSQAQQAQDAKLTDEISAAHTELKRKMLKGPQDAQNKLSRTVDDIIKQCRAASYKGVADEKVKQLTRRRRGTGSVLSDAAGGDRAALLRYNKELVKNCSDTAIEAAMRTYQSELRDIDFDIQRLDAAISAAEQGRIRLRAGSEEQRLSIMRSFQAIDQNLQRTRARLLGEIETEKFNMQRSLQNITMQIAQLQMQIAQSKGRVQRATSSSRALSGVTQKDRDNANDAMEALAAFDERKRIVREACCDDTTGDKFPGTNPPSGICVRKSPTTPAANTSEGDK